jgi:hypothetical protein
MGIYQIFVYLQLLDLLTTLLGFRVGAAEASPFIRLLMHAGPAAGVIASKVLALGLGALCVYTNKPHVGFHIGMRDWWSGTCSSCLPRPSTSAAEVYRCISHDEVNAKANRSPASARIFRHGQSARCGRFNSGGTKPVMPSAMCFHMLYLPPNGGRRFGRPCPEPPAKEADRDL